MIKPRNILLKSDDDDRAIKLIKELTLRYRQETSQLRLKWLLCAAFVKGIHYAYLDRNTNTLVTQQLEEGRKRSKTNRIGSWWWHMQARVSVSRPTWEVQPLDLSPEETSAAKGGTAFLQSHAQNISFELKRIKIANYLLTFGNAFSLVRSFTDKHRFQALPKYYADGTPEIDEETGEQAVIRVPIRDVDSEIFLPHNLLTENDDTEIDDKWNIILSKWRGLDYYLNQYGAKGAKVKPENRSTDGSSYGLDIISDVKGASTQTEGANEIIYLQKPSELNPSGCIKIIANGVMLEKSEWPSDYKNMSGYPIVHFRWGDPPAGEFWSRSPVEDQIPLVKDLDETLSIMMENASNMGHLKWMNPIGSGIKNISDLSGEFINYNPGYEPHPSNVNSLPAYISRLPDLLIRELEDVQMFHSVSKGAGVTAVRSGVGINALQEEDSMPLNVIDVLMSNSYESFGKKILQVGANVLDEPRLISYIGEGRRRRIADFTNKMLNGAGDVKVRMTDTHLRNKGVTQNLIMELFTRGMITDSLGKIDQVHALKLLEFALPESVYDRNDKQREMAYDENELLLKGEAVTVEEWEFHFIHLEAHEEFFNSSEWKALGKTNPGVRQVSVEHRQAHIAFIMKAIQAQAPKGQVEQGTAPTGA